MMTYSPTVADMGPMLIIARDYYDKRVKSGEMAARVLRGERPADIPFQSGGENRLYRQPQGRGFVRGPDFRGTGRKGQQGDSLMEITQHPGVVSLSFVYRPSGRHMGRTCWQHYRKCGAGRLASNRAYFCRRGLHQLARHPRAAESLQAVEVRQGQPVPSHPSDVPARRPS